MDLNQILIWTVCISCIALLIRARQLFLSSQPGWVIVCVAILASVGISVKIAPQLAGYLGGVLWLTLIFLPLIANRRLQSSILLEDYAKASKQAAFWRWFHPVDGWWEQPQILKALALAQQGNSDRAISILNRYSDRRPYNQSLTWVATALAYKANFQWQKLIELVRKELPEKVLINSPNLICYYIQALGETGNINEAIAEFYRLKVALDPQRFHYTAVLVLAFAGETNAVANLFRTALAGSSKCFQLFWLATAQIAAGSQTLGRDLLNECSKNIAVKSNKSDRLALDNWQNYIKWRWERGCLVAEKFITPISRQIIEEIDTQIAREFKYGGALKFSSKKAFATYGLIAINCLMFAWETVAGGNENEETLYRLGALVPTVVWQGEWWRLLAATFLHYGILHLSMNMLGLYYLGSYVESSFGFGRYLIAYFFSGIGSMSAVTLIAIFTNSPPQLLVGASGAIMGMVGALAAILLRGWLIDKAPLAGQRFRSVMFIIGLQTVFDLNTPQVSFLGHISGLILGFAIACFFVFMLPKSKL